jgi:hypothetical protein
MLTSVASPATLRQIAKSSLAAIASRIVVAPLVGGNAKVSAARGSSIAEASST